MAPHSRETSRRNGNVSDSLSPESMEVVKKVMSRPSPFDYFAIDHDPIGAWIYVYREMEGITPAERHALLRTVAAVRRGQGGRIDEERTARMLDEVLRSGATP